MSGSEELLELECELADRVGRVELLGELDLSDAAYEELADRIAALLQRCGPAQGTTRLLEAYPHAAASYLVFAGIRSYEQGDYWSQTCARVGLPRANYPQRWGQAFLELLKRRKLPTFHHLRGHRYITRILLHGGVPASCLGDYLERLVIPGVTSPQWAGLSAAELISAWSDSRLRFGDKPVNRFLEQGGREAEEFLDRSLDYARAALGQSTLPDAAGYGLPQALQAALDTLLSADPSVRAWGRAGSARSRWTPPRLAFAPWGEGVVLRLPGQVVAGREATWEVVLDQDVFVHRPQQWQSTEGLVLEEESLRPTRPFRRARVRLLVEGLDQGLGCTLAGLSEPPLLVFDGETGLAVPADRLAGGSAWFVAPDDVRVEGGRPLSPPVPLTAGWNRYRAHCLDLSECTQLHVVQGDRTSPLLLDPLRQPVRVVGEPVRGAVAMSGGAACPLFAADVWVEVPASSRPRTLTVLPGVGALPSMPWSLELPPGPPERLKLSPPGVPAEWFGAFKLQLRGALGTGSRASFGIVPGFELRRGLQPTPHAVVRAPACSVYAEGALGVRFEVPAERRSLDLLLARGEAVVSVRVESPQPRWALLGVGHGAEVVAWSSTPLETDRDVLAAAEAPRLVALCPLVEETSCLRLCLHLPAGESLQDLRSVQGDGRVLSFDLSELRGTLRDQQTPGLALNLRTPGLDLEVVRIRSRWSPGQLEVESYAVSPRRVLARWSATGVRPQGCELLLFDLGRPWRRPLRLDVREEERNSAAWDVSDAELPTGHYRASLRIRDPWAGDPQPWDLPGEEERGVCTFEITEASEPSGEEPTQPELIVAAALSAPDRRRALQRLARLPARVPDDQFRATVETLVVLRLVPGTPVTEVVRQRLEEGIRCRHRGLLSALAALGEHLPARVLRDLAWDQALGQRIATRHRMPWTKRSDGARLQDASEELTAREVDALLAPSAATEIPELQPDEIDRLATISPALAVFLDARPPQERRREARQRLERLLGGELFLYFHPLRDGIPFLLEGQVGELWGIEEDALELGDAVLDATPPAGLSADWNPLGSADSVSLTFLEGGGLRVEREDEERELPPGTWQVGLTPPSILFGLSNRRWRRPLELASQGKAVDLQQLGPSGHWSRSGLLHPDTLDLAFHEILERVSACDRGQVRYLCTEFTTWLRFVVEATRSRYPALDNHARVILQRPGRQPEGLHLLNLPFVSLATAFAQRLVAHRLSAELDVRNLEQQLADGARTLATLAPTLYERDLCLAELLLAWYSEALP